VYFTIKTNIHIRSHLAQYSASVSASVRVETVLV